MIEPNLVVDVWITILFSFWNSFDLTVGLPNYFIHTSFKQVLQVDGKFQRKKKKTLSILFSPAFFTRTKLLLTKSWLNLREILRQIIVTFRQMEILYIQYIQPISAWWEFNIDVSSETISIKRQYIHEVFWLNCRYFQIRYYIAYLMRMLSLYWYYNVNAFNFLYAIFN